MRTFDIQDKVFWKVMMLGPGGVITWLAMVPDEMNSDFLNRDCNFSANCAAKSLVRIFAPPSASTGLTAASYFSLKALGATAGLSLGIASVAWLLSIGSFALLVKKLTSSHKPEDIVANYQSFDPHVQAAIANAVENHLEVTAATDDARTALTLNYITDPSGNPVSATQIDPRTIQIFDTQITLPQTRDNSIGSNEPTPPPHENGDETASDDDTHLEYSNVSP